MNKGASADAETGSREPSPDGLGPLGFDPARDGFPNSRLLMVLGNVATQAAKATAELSYGSWNPLFMSAHAATEAITVFASLKRHIEFYERQAAIAMEARQGRDGETRLDPKDDSAGPKDIAHNQSGASNVSK